MGACATRLIPPGLLNPGQDFPFDQRLRRNSFRAARSNGDAVLPRNSTQQIREHFRRKRIPKGDADSLDCAMRLAELVGQPADASGERGGSGGDRAVWPAAEKLAIVAPRARGTKLSMGVPPEQYDLAIDLTRMDRVIAYDPGDLTLSVEPGIRLGRLRIRWRSTSSSCLWGFRLPTQATIGGTHCFGRRCAAAAALRHAPRLRAWRGIRYGRRRADEERRARGEERHGLRFTQIDDWRHRYSRRSLPAQFQNVSDAESSSWFHRALW